MGATIQITPDDDLAAVLAGALPGSSFILEPGTYNLTETLILKADGIIIRPRDWPKDVSELAWNAAGEYLDSLNLDVGPYARDELARTRRRQRHELGKIMQKALDKAVGRE